MKGNHHPRQKVSIDQSSRAARPSLNPESRHRYDKNNQHLRHHGKEDGVKDRRQEVRLFKQILEILYVQTLRNADGAFQEPDK